MEIPEMNGNDIGGLRGINLVEFYGNEKPAARLDKLAEEYKEVNFSRLDTSRNAGAATEHRVGNLPTYILFSDGRELGRTSGGGRDGDERVIRTLIDRETIPLRGSF